MSQRYSEIFRVKHAHKARSSKLDGPHAVFAGDTDLCGYGQLADSGDVTWENLLLVCLAILTT